MTQQQVDVADYDDLLAKISQIALAHPGAVQGHAGHGTVTIAYTDANGPATVAYKTQYVQRMREEGFVSEEGELDIKEIVDRLRARQSPGAKRLEHWGTFLNLIWQVPMAAVCLLIATTICQVADFYLDHMLERSFYGLSPRWFAEIAASTTALACLLLGMVWGSKYPPYAITIIVCCSGVVAGALVAFREMPFRMTWLLAGLGYYLAYRIGILIRRRLVPAKKS